MKIGVMVESFRLGFRGGVEKAASLGIEGIQKYCTGEEMTWTDAQIKEALDKIVDALVAMSEGRMPEGMDPSMLKR